MLDTKFEMSHNLDLVFNRILTVTALAASN
jgi:hypothetical protein